MGDMKKIYYGIFFGIILMLILIVVKFFGEKTEEEIEIIPAGKTIFVENGKATERCDLEEFLPCVVAKIFSIDENEELLKMQMIIARTYLEKKLENRVSENAKNLGVSYYSYRELEKLYGTDYPNKYKKWKKLIQETNLIVIRYKDELIDPYFHIASNGMTRDGNEVLGGKHDYLQSVESKFDLEYKENRTIQYITIREFVDKLKKQNEAYEIEVSNFFDQFSIKETCSAGYVKKVSVGNETIGSEAFCRLFQIPSQYFRIEKYQSEKEPMLRIIARGRGNGLGVSLYGAKVMAEQGKKYQEILEYYYKNVLIG